MSEQVAPAPSGEPAKAGGGLRALAAVAALVLAFGAAVMIVAALDINDTPTLQEVADGKPLHDGSYYDGSETKRTFGVVMLIGSGVLGGLAVLASLAFAITGRRGRPVLMLTGAAVLLAVIALVVS